VWPVSAFRFGAPYQASNANSEKSFLLLNKTLWNAGKILNWTVLRSKRIKQRENGNIDRNYETGQNPKPFLPFFHS